MERCTIIITGNAGGEDTWQLYSGKDFIESGVPSTPELCSVSMYGTQMKIELYIIAAQDEKVNLQLKQEPLDEMQATDGGGSTQRNQ